MKLSTQISISGLIAASILFTGCGGGDSASTTASGICNTGSALVFNDDNWNYYDNANTTVAPSGTTELEFMADGVFAASGVVFLNESMVPPYSVEFEYSIYDEDGNLSSFNSADGIAVMLSKDESPYTSTTPPNGGSRGFITGSGYGVHFSTYGSRVIKIADGSNNDLITPVSASPSVYSHGLWRKVKVDVLTDRIDVTYEGTTTSYSGAINDTYDSVGFGAATGGADGQHKIRNVTCTN